MRAWQATGRKPKALSDGPRLPDGCEQLWSDFLELHSCRGSTGAGPCRITYADIDAWQRVEGVLLEGWQIEAIKRADNAYLAHQARRT